ncbi:hypothetical protein [Pseudonocardia sp. KRD291]|uniref:hypothetical protein n=1 Tax=Pseudonocardia sp. KRD291 TaxID=2792007 RepID=UPI001C49D483|nr:hypothetical protein [Pseudonocardia sp. KRD291]MBW0103312.1 hypothetical protein [Pseudonocardia sp. KRD291]
MTSIGRARARAITGGAAALLALTVAGGCAQPGQLGHEGGEPPADGAAPGTPGGPAAPGPDGSGGQPGVPPGGPAAQIPGASVATAGSDARGTVTDPVQISTPGRAVFLVRTEILQPGQSTGWITHPGTVISVVRSGTVSVVRAQACEPARFGAEQAFFLGDGEANELRNDGPDPAVLTRSELLAPDTDERRPAEPACAAP